MFHQFQMVLAFLVFICCIVPLSAEKLPYYLPSDNFAIDCSPSDPSPFLSSTDNNQLSLNFSTVSRVYALDPDYALHPDKPEKPKISACLYTEQYTHPIPVSVGPKFIRLYFIPIPYSGLNLSKALFSVTVGNYTLLTTSQSSYSKLNSGQNYLLKEFCINSEGHILNVTFTPSSEISGAYAFVNRIQIVSMPSKLYIQENVALPLVSLIPSHYSLHNSTALETMHRLNIGGDVIHPEDDSGMLRLWSNEIYYLMSDEGETSTIQSQVEIKPSSLEPAYAAPIQVYASARTVLDASASNYSARWSFPVESGFYYLIRLHFCEISSMIEQDNQRVFHIYINNQTAEDHADIFNWRHGSGLPIYRDYIVNFSRRNEGIKFLSISLSGKNGSSAGPILNGLEILKLSDFSNNLAGHHPFGVRIHPNLKFPDFEDCVKDHQDVILSVFGFFDWSLMAVCFLGSLLELVSEWRKKTSEQGQSSEYCRIFSIADIKLATNNFANTQLIGSGGFGMVYKGSIDGGNTTVAIKRAKANSHQGLKEFQTEISMLSELRHCHLVSLIGYGVKDEEMILVYEYMAQGTLRDHLYNTQKSPLPWKQRLKICIGAARGLHYLHTGKKNSIIHRDIKSSNILLNEKLVAKISDFGLSRFGPCGMAESKTHVSTMVKGTFGYLDPEYFRRQKLTEKSDVYSFGVVLLEILCARPAVMAVGENEEEEEEYEKVSLAEWAMNCYQGGTIEQIIDPYLKEKIAPQCFKTFTDIAIKCLASRGSERPSMGDVLYSLEVAIQQQNACELQENTGGEESNRRMNTGEVSIMTDDGECICFHHSDQTPGVEFSEIMFPIGR